MPPSVATVIYSLGILGLFWLDRGHRDRVSGALWIPTVWLALIGSRPVSWWFGMTPTGQLADVYLEGSPVDRAVFMVLVLVGLLVLLRRRGEVGPVLRKNWPVALFFAYAAVSILWSNFPFVTFKHWIKGVGDVVVVLIVLTEPSITGAVSRLVTRLGFTLLPLSVLLGKYYPGVGSFIDRSWEREWIGVTMQKNSLGVICFVFGLGLLWRFRQVYNDGEASGRGRRLLALGTVLGMACWLLYMCNSITSISALAMGGVLLLLSGRPSYRRRRGLVHVVIVAMLALAVYAVFLQGSRSLVEDLGRTGSMSGRTEIWATVLSVPVSRWVGAGYESFWLGTRLGEIDNQVGQPINEAHNGYIEMLLNLGWIGVGLLGFLIAFGYRNVFRGFRCDPDTGSFRVACFVAVLLCNLSTAQFRELTPPWVFFLLVMMDVSWLPVRRGRSDGVGESAENLVSHDLEAEQVLCV